MPRVAREEEDEPSQGIGQVAADYGREGDQGRVQCDDRAVLGINFGRREEAAKMIPRGERAAAQQPAREDKSR
jgi:hypothetical protein